MSDTAAKKHNTNNIDPPKQDDINKNKPNVEGSKFECYICLDVAKDAVVSMCGHLFCWPCLHQWLDARPNRQLCPVCKSAISADKVIPLYGRSGSESDPREKVPPRPQGQRSEDTSSGFPNSGFYWGGENGHGGVQFSLGIGVFPLSIFAAFFNNSGFFGGNNASNVPGARRTNAPSNSQQRTEEQFLSNIFFIIGIFFIVWLLLI